MTMTTLLYTIWIAYTVGTLFFMLFWGTLFVFLVRGSKDCQCHRKVTKIPKEKRELLLEIDRKENLLRD